MVIDTLQLDIIVNNKGTTARINSTTNALKNLHKVISDINGAGGVDGTINGGGGGRSSSSGGSSRSSGAKGATNLAKNLSKSLNFGSMVAKLYFIRNITKQLGQDLAKVVQRGIDYGETLNLWQTAMRGNISQARTFVREMNKAYGISSMTLMNYQAIFKNMLSALGNISEATAYGLSEALTQMAVDFASLYNTSIDEAMTKFQAVLSGQVRPIRTAGYDITENTIFALYQSLGGTKTVRQLNQTEKQLLRILAVYEQMSRSGATGDLAKTLGSSANQLRMMKEQAQEFTTWIGVGFNTLMEKSGILVNINAGLYVLTELAKSLAYTMGYVEPDWGIEFAEGVEKGEEEVENLKESLLGFDKFQVLQSAEVIGDGTSIEQTLLDALKEYQGIFDGVDNPAVKKATSFLEALGGKLVEVKNEAGEVVGYIWEFPPALTETVKLIGSLVAALATLGLIALEKKLWSVVKGISGVGNAMTLLRVGGLGLLIYGLTNLITKWDELSVGMKIVYGAVTVLGAAMIFFSSTTLKEKLVTALLAAQINFGNLGLAITSVTAQTLGFAAAIGLAFAVFSNWEYMNGMQKIVSVLGVLTVALLSAAIAFGAFHSAWSLGLAVAGIAAGIVAVTASVNSAKANIDSMEVPKYAKGGLADKGSLFYAGEAGPELVTQTSGGGSTIMNMKQLEDAVAKGFIRGFASTDKGYEDTDETNVYVDGQRLFNIMRNTAKRNGYDFVRV